jgi:hypothetical protein
MDTPPEGADVVHWGPMTEIDKEIVRELMGQMPVEESEEAAGGGLEGGALDSGGTTIIKRYAFNGQVVATRRDGTLYYLRPDHLGSASLMLDSAGRPKDKEYRKVERYLRYVQTGASLGDGTS